MSNKLNIYILILVITLKSTFFISISGESQNAAVMCKLPEARGHCRALLLRWRYDPTTRKCHEFKFGGCDGNGNNFISEKACMKVCAVIVISMAVFKSVPAAVAAVVIMQMLHLRPLPRDLSAPSPFSLPQTSVPISR